MNVLFLVNNTRISPNANGGASVYYSHLEMLYKLGYDVHVLLLEWNQQQNIAELSDEINTEYIEEINSFYKSVSLMQVAYEIPKMSLKRLWNAINAPEKFEYHFINSQNEDILQKYCTDKNINLIWAEWRWTALLTEFTQINIPKIYAHHDWEFKLGKLRQEKQSLKHKFHLYQKKRAELKLIRNVEGCVSASFTETQELDEFGAKKTVYIPLTYDKVALTNKNTEKPSIVHLGGMGTTANRIGLERFLEVCWDEIKQKLPEVRLKVIGNLKYASESLKKRLEDPQIECLGFVENLENVLQPYNIHIIPWEHNTGTRTRIPLVFNYAQVLVSTKAAASCYPEVIHDQNSMLSDNLTQMTSHIIDLYNDTEKRIFTGDNARNTFLECFTINAQLEKLKQFLEGF